MDKTQLAQTQWFLYFLQGPLCLKCVNLSGVSVHDHCTPTSPSGWKGLEEKGASGSAPSHFPSQSPERWLSSGQPKTEYCLGIHVTLTKERRAEPLPPHTWIVPVVEDMLWHSRTDLTEALVIGLGRAVLFYGRWSLGEGLSLGEARDVAFTLTGAGTWVGKSAHLADNPLTIQEGQWVITQAITKCQIEARGPGHPCSCPTTPQPFRFYCGDESSQEECIEDAGFDHQPPLHKAIARQGSWLMAKEPKASDTSPPHLPQIVDSKAIEVLCQQPHQYHYNLIGQKSPNVPVMADIIGNLGSTWRSISPSLKMRMWRMPSLIKVGDGIWLNTIGQGVKTVSSTPTHSNHCKGILEFMRNSSMDITLDNVLTISDEYYNNVKVLDALNQELFQLWMGKKETMLDWGVQLSRHLQVLAASFPEDTPQLGGRLPKCLKAMVAYLKASPQEKTYSNYLQAMREAKRKIP